MCHQKPHVSIRGFDETGIEAGIKVGNETAFPTGRYSTLDQVTWDHVVPLWTKIGEMAMEVPIAESPFYESRVNYRVLRSTPHGVRAGPG